MHGNDVVLASVIQDVGDLSLDLQWLFDERILGLMVIAFAVWAWWKTKSTLAGGAALVAGVLLWSLALSREDIRDGIDEDVSNPGQISEPADGDGP